MPEKYQTKLRILCKPYKQIKVIVSGTADVYAGLLPELNAMREKHKNKGVIQFRKSF